jgi:Terminase large subunit, T4likevirus-type, N-terminal
LNGIAGFFDDRFELAAWYFGSVCKTFDDSLLRTIRRRAQKPPEPVDAVTFARTRLGFEPDAMQMEVLQSNAKRGILNCSRQWGKSTVTVAKAVHRAYTRPGSTVLVASPSQRQSAEFLRKAAAMVRKLRIRPRGDGYNATSLLLPNGSRIIGLPGTHETSRGFSASLILIDEASRVHDDVYDALRPMLAVEDGDLWMMSTPAGQHGFFYEAWAGNEDWFRMSVKATECPRISAQFLERERAGMVSGVFEQEYMCGFHGDGTEYFDRQTVLDAVDLSIPELSI